MGIALRPKNKKRLRLWLALVLTMPFMTGCWDRLEIEQRAVILGLSIDSEESGQSDGSAADDLGATDATNSGQVRTSDNNQAFELTAQIAVPGRIPLGPGGGEGGGGGSAPRSAIWVLHSTGRTIEDALAQLQQRVADRLFLGHLRVIVVSEDFAKKQGVKNLTDFLLRNPAIRRTAWLVVSKGRASELMQTAPPLERVPTLYLMSTMDHAAQAGKLPMAFFGKFVSQDVMMGRDPVLPYLEDVGKDSVNASGLAFFKNDKMVGATPRPVDILPYMELDGIKAGGYTIMVPVPGHTGTVMWHAMRRKKRISVSIRNGVPHFVVKVHVDGNIEEKSDEGFTIDDPQLIHTIDEKIATDATKNMEKFLTMTKELQIDPIGFGEYVRARSRVFWDTNVKTKEKWEAMYPRTTMDIEMDVKTDRIGMKIT